MAVRHKFHQSEQQVVIVMEPLAHSGGAIGACDTVQDLHRKGSNLRP